MLPFADLNFAFLQIRSMKMRHLDAAVAECVDLIRRQTLDGVRWFGHSDIPVMDLHLQALLRCPVQPVPHQEGAVLPVQRRRDVDADVLLLVQWTDPHFERVFT